jgi:hypothetical protein
MANNVKFKRSSVPNKIPTTGDLELGNLAINTYDGRLFLKKDTTSTGGAESIVTLGERGYTGSQGPIGYTGSQGIVGYVGSQGDLGYTGSQGADGYTGSKGVEGYAGSRGVDGYTGSQGADGYIGADGYTGSKGVEGYAGSRGVDGYTGSQGADGYTGSFGYTGSIGYTGSLGDTGIYIGSTPPPETDVLWLDTNDAGGLDIFGLPPDGLTNQVLTKSSDLSYDVEWTSKVPYRSATTNTTINITDSVIFADGTFTVTLPSAISATGSMYTIKNTGSGEITVTPVLSQLIDNSPFLILGETNTALSLVSTGSNWAIV